jgi:hypothetical protein
MLKINLAARLQTTHAFCPKCRQLLARGLFGNATSRHRYSYCLTCQHAYNREQRAKFRFEVLSHYSNGTPHCACCDELEIEFLTIDHVHNDGARRRQEDKGHRFIIQWLRAHGLPPGFQVLCMNCNLATRDGNICPHRRGLDIKAKDTHHPPMSI